jgi:hypothetical protein
MVRKVNGIGNKVVKGRGEFIVTNDDTHEIWRLNGSSITDFKNWYKAILACEDKITGSYPYYDIR